MDRSRLAKFIDQRVGELPLAEPVFLPPTASVRTAVQRMHTGARSCVLAVEQEELVGIFTERDVLTRCMSGDFDWDQPLAPDLLTRNPVTIASSTTVGDAIALMQRYNYRTLPVMEDGAVIGLVRLGELLQHFAESFPEEVLNLPPRPHQVVAKREGG
ncbi:MAG: CBS domain-containing protein [Chloroflexota bacterium]|nr:CBS domain-containing protein [Chloroflexota bacterium]